MISNGPVYESGVRMDILLKTATQIIQYDNLVADPDKFTGDMRPDESGTSRNK